MPLNPLRAFEITRQLAAARTSADVLDWVAAETAALGSSTITLGYIDEANTAKPLSIVCANGPADYFKHYVQERYDLCSPVVAQMRRSRDPFRWSSVRYDKAANPKGHLCVSEAHDAGLEDGLCIPVRGSDDIMNGWVTIFTQSGRFDVEAIDTLHFAGLSAHRRMREVARTGKAALRASLTPREREVLQWVAGGKTSEEIAVILNIAPRTIEQHVSAAAYKLDATNRVQTVVEAMRTGEIRL